MGWICGALKISKERTFYFILEMSFVFGEGANGNLFQRQWPDNEW
jgi:hypothetical protein